VTIRQVALQGTLASAGLLAAYFTWQRGVELAPGEVFVVDIAKNDLASVRFEDQEKSTWVELGRMSDAGNTFTSVRLSAQDKPAAGKEQAPSKIPERLLRGSEAADRLFASFAPWRASRGLGVLDPAKLKDLGLDSAKKRITLRLRSGERTFAIAPAPPGGIDPYLRDEASGQVYLVARSFISDFQSAPSLLVERHLHGFKIEEADRLAIARGGSKWEFLVTRADDGVRLSPIKSPDKPDTALATWHSRAFSLWPVEVLGKDETPAEGTPQPELRIDYTLRGRPLGFFEVAKVAARSSGAEGAKDTLFARSEQALGWQRLGTDAQSLLSDLDGLLR
jgi:hypothetical protein